MSADRRRSLRVPCDLEVTWRRGGQRHQLRAVDQSARGLLVVTDQPVELQFTMDLVLELPEPIEVFGVARFVGQTRFGRGVGISLLAMTTEENERWWAYYRTSVAKAQQPARYSSADIMARLGI